MKLQLPALTFREWNGTLTGDLARESAGFGLGQLPKHQQPTSVARTVCGFCSTGCGLKIHLKDGQAIGLTPDPDYPVNLGSACPKGWEALQVLDSPERGTTPLINGKPVEWDEAMRYFTTEMKRVITTHGREAAAFISTGQLMTEEMAYLGALAKFGMGMIHGDGNTRQCMATAVTAYKESFGFDAPPFSYADFEESDVLVFIGANPCIAHPILWQRVLMNQRQPKIIVIDPRYTETAAAATHHYAIKPKSDLSLLYGLARSIITAGGVDETYVRDHVSGYEAFASFVEAWTPDRVGAETGVTVDQLMEFTQSIISGTPRVSFWWTMGVNQGHQATRTAQAIINLALITGNIGKPGTGANSITGQCNAMGSRLFSNTTNLLGGHDFRREDHRQKIATALNMPVTAIPDQPSLAYDQIVTGIEEGRIKALWIIATNPAHSWINSDRFRHLTSKLDLLVVQDMYATTETAQLADLYLPAAAWGEKEGTFINSERRIGLSHKVSQAPGKALADFHIFRLIAHYWGCAEAFKEWTSPERVFQVLKRCSAGQPCDITGIRDYAMLEEHGGIQWPFRPEDTLETHRLLFADGQFFTAERKAFLKWDIPQSPKEDCDADYPFVLLTGRGSSAQWHTETRTRQSEILRKLAPTELAVEISPSDAARLNIQDGDRIAVSSRRGRLTAAARVLAAAQCGTVFLPMHDAQVNRLTFEEVDPLSRQPSYKFCAVQLEKVRL